MTYCTELFCWWTTYNLTVTDSYNKAFESLSLESLTLGMLSLEQTPSASSRSLISQAKMDGHSLLYWAIFVTTSGVATLGLLPPMARGRMDPVS